MTTPPTLTDTQPAFQLATRYVLAMLAGAVLAAYANGWSIPFQFDDWHAVEQNPHLRSLTNIPRFFYDPNTTTLVRESKDLRPLLLITFAINHLISGTQTWSYHGVSLLLHWLAAALVFRIVRDHLWLGAAALPVAVTAALLVAVHPLNTEPVNYISARSAVLTTVFYLAAFDAAVRRRRVRALLFLAGALLTKTIAVTFPFTLLLYLLVARAQRLPDGPRELPWGFLGTLTLCAAGGILYRLALLPSWVTNVPHNAVYTPWTYFMTEWWAYLYYLRLFLWPTALAVDYVDFPPVLSLAWPRAWGALLVLTALVYGAWRARRRAPVLTFGIGWYLVSLSTESTFFALEPVNLHRPYLAMLGMTCASAYLLWRAAEAVATRVALPARHVFAVGATFLVCVLGATTFVRNEAWRDPFILWMDSAQKRPHNPRTWLTAGHVAMQRKQYDLARELLLKAHDLAPNYSLISTNLSELEGHTGHRDEAVRWADEAVRAAPDNAIAALYRGSALEQAGRIDDALAEYQRSTTIDDQQVDGWFDQGNLFEQRGAFIEAATAFDRSFAVFPTLPDGAMRAGVLYHYRLADLPRAIEHYQTVLRVQPDHYGAHYQLAVALLAANRLAEARRTWAEFLPLAHAVGDQVTLDNAPAALRDWTP